MSFTLIVDTKPDQISLTISNFSDENEAHIRKRVTEVESVLKEILAFDDVVSGLSETDHNRLRPGLSALSLKYEMILHAAAQQALVAVKVAEGLESISDHGFPEFDHA